jgi:hypothetical protein
MELRPGMMAVNMKDIINMVKNKGQVYTLGQIRNLFF